MTLALEVSGYCPVSSTLCGCRSRRGGGYSATAAPPLPLAPATYHDRYNAVGNPGSGHVCLNELSLRAATAGVVGNLGPRTTYTLTSLPHGGYHWVVGNLGRVAYTLTSLGLRAATSWWVTSASAGVILTSLPTGGYQARWVTPVTTTYTPTGWPPGAAATNGLTRFLARLVFVVVTLGLAARFSLLLHHWTSHSPRVWWSGRP